MNRVGLEIAVGARLVLSSTAFVVFASDTRLSRILMSPKFLSDLSFFDGKSVLITGRTRSFERCLARTVLQKSWAKKVIVFSRDELKQFDKAHEFNGNSRIRLFLGDVREKDRLYRAFEHVDIVVHAAAMAAGQLFTSQNVRSIRPNAGLQFRHPPEVLGRTSRRELKRGTPLQWDMLQ